MVTPFGSTCFSLESIVVAFKADISDRSGVRYPHAAKPDDL